ncbi:glycosyltransferase family 4 protein [Flavihumibacter sp. ZG627]|uniref:glycosyltransferase family 4 protein n=1 Tax=Flavihumibacter sp. ZG627 TaxID=1463156 RepID=UPI00058053E6|nr:MraY family glycosyltransferase [Flavihumibacter sp. ZG627]KIC92304.1 hypothetical protein HY58_01835 [Flavihumibacter sp. ZG627]
MLLTNILIFILSAILSARGIKSIIRISHKKHLFDEPTEARKLHKSKTPNLGGAAIIGACMIVSSLLPMVNGIKDISYLATASMCILILGITDDLEGVKPIHKLIVQLVISLMLSIVADIRINSLYGIFGVNEIGYTASIMLTALFIISVINSINLIDGINWLAGSISLLICGVYAFFFHLSGDAGYGLLAISVAGSICGFLWYNKTPARIFMGDTGSLFLGLAVAIFSIRFLELHRDATVAMNNSVITNAPVIVMALLIVPAYDTIRIFLLRLSQKKSPFKADRNHLHHLLVDELGLGHIHTSIILVITTGFIFTIATSLKGVGLELPIYIILVMAGSLNMLLIFAIRMKRRNQKKSYQHSMDIKAKFPPPFPHVSKIANTTIISRQTESLKEIAES